MSRINPETSLLEIAVLVSEALVDAKISAVLGGGGAVTQYSNNQYMSKDLDFITVLKVDTTVATFFGNIKFDVKAEVAVLLFCDHICSAILAAIGNAKNSAAPARRARVIVFASNIGVYQRVR